MLRAFLAALKAARGTVVIIGERLRRVHRPVRARPTRRPRRARSRSRRGAGFEADGEVRCTGDPARRRRHAILDNRPEPPDAETRAQMLQAEDVAAACVFAVSLPPRAYVAGAHDPADCASGDREDDVSQRSTT